MRLKSLRVYYKYLKINKKILEKSFLVMEICKKKYEILSDFGVFFITYEIKWVHLKNKHSI